MRTIEGNAVITPDNQLRVQVPPDIAPGEHHIVLVIDEQPMALAPREPLNLPTLDLGPWPEGLSLRREDM